MNRIYLDHNATTRIDDAVLAEMTECYRAGHVNPASQHADGRAARRLVETARETIGRALDIRDQPHESDQIVFTSGGTEANNLAIFGLTGSTASSDPGRIIVSAIEHPSVLDAARHQRSAGFDVQFLRVNSDGVCDLEHLNELLTDNTRLVSVMWGNNETGVMQPVEQIAALCRSRAVLFHCDAVQCVGKIPVSFRDCDFAAMTFSPHKFHGPAGIGGLVLRHDVALQPTLFGGAQQYGLRPGTESAPLAVGAAVAISLANADFDLSEKLCSLRDRLEAKIASAVDGCVLIGKRSPRLPHTSNPAFTGINRQAFLMAADMAGLSLSSGSACSSGSSEPSHVLTAMGLDSALIGSAIRISLGTHTTAREVDLATDRIIRICNDLRSDSRGL